MKDRHQCSDLHSKDPRAKTPLRSKTASHGNIKHSANKESVHMTTHLYIIAGCNGAGKTTASKTLLPKSLLVKEFVNADEIAKGLSPFNPEGVAIEAGRLMLHRIFEKIKDYER
jgi:hypothetical protein